nr:reverse transcriptase domain-containing protein [Tanacetum cinerariifolium]
MSPYVITVGLTMRIPLLCRDEYSQWSERFMNYLEEQTDEEAMINSIKIGEQPLHVVAQVSLAKVEQNAPPTLKDPKFLTAEEKKTQKIDQRYLELNYKFLNNLQPKWKQYGTLMRQTKNLMDINIDAFYNILKQNQGDLNNAMRYRKKAVVVTLYPLALVVEKTKVSKRKEKVVVHSKFERSDDEDISNLKKITAMLAKAFNRKKNYAKPTNNNLRTSSASSSTNKKAKYKNVHDLLKKPLPSLTGLKLVQESIDKVVLEKERPKAVKDRQKSYVDFGRNSLEFEVGDRVLLKVTPWKGVVRFGKKVKSQDEISIKREYCDNRDLSSLTGLKLVQESIDKVVLEKERPKAVKDRQKSYVDFGRNSLEFEVGDHVLLKVTPWKGVVRFGKKEVNDYLILCAYEFGVKYSIRSHVMIMEMKDVLHALQPEIIPPPKPFGVDFNGGSKNPQELLLGASIQACVGVVWKLLVHQVSFIAPFSYVFGGENDAMSLNVLVAVIMCLYVMWYALWLCDQLESFMCDSLLLTPLCCDNIHDVARRIFALAGCDSVWSSFGDVSLECLYPSDIELLLVAFDSQLKVFDTLKNDNTSEVVYFLLELPPCKYSRVILVKSIGDSFITFFKMIFEFHIALECTFEKIKSWSNKVILGQIINLEIVDDIC